MAAPDHPATDGRFAEAYRAMRADPSLQLRLRPPEPPPEPPKWVLEVLRAIGRALKAIGEFLEPVARLLRWLFGWLPDLPYFTIILWTVIGLAAAMLLWVIIERVRSGVWRAPWRRRPLPGGEPPPEEEWAPEAQAVHAWLEEADRLAAAGRYAEAAHALLLRSVEDLARRRPTLVKPAVTSRELAAAEAVPPGARAIFADIARLVERSLFGARVVIEPEWRAARDAYADFAMARMWAK